jgi:hypothetical protein
MEDRMPAAVTTKRTADTEADATTTVIAGLRTRLARGEAVEHPAVQRELRKLDELLINLLDQAGHKPGRHRSSAPATAS